MTIKRLLLTFFVTISAISSSLACSPCGALSNITQTLNGNNLELTFTSNAGWNCCYTVQIELICASDNFTGIANYQSAQICFNGGTGPSTTNNTPMDYPLTVLDVSNLCPGMYKWRAMESGCYIYTAEYTFEIVGSPLLLDVAASETTICETDNTQLSATVSGGCSGAGLTYSWTPASGLSNPNIANPVATPGVTTTYTCTVTETTSNCLAGGGQSESADITITVNPLPTATIGNSISVCQDDSPPDITFTGGNATAPYTINYTLNGVAQTAVVTNGNTATISVPTGTPGTYTYSLIDVTESSSTQCAQTVSGNAVIVVNPLPVVEAGSDQEICEPNPTSPSEITLSASGAGAGGTYVWDNGAVNGVSFVPPSGITVFTVVGTDVNGCQDSDFLTVQSYPQPIAEASANNVFGNVPVSVDFTNLSIYADQYTWYFGDGSTVNTTDANGIVSYTYNTPGIYTVTLIASNGICYDEYTLQIEVLPPMEVLPPNIFTPNGDGVNDDYIVDVKYGEAFEATVLNRWGNEITTFTHLDQGWNGKSNGVDVNEGVYYILYKAIDFAGHVIEGHAVFTLIR